MQYLQKIKDICKIKFEMLASNSVMYARVGAGETNQANKDDPNEDGLTKNFY